MYRPASSDGKLPSLAHTASPPISINTRRVSSARSPHSRAQLLSANPRTPTKLMSFNRPSTLLVRDLKVRRPSVGSEEAMSKRLPATPQTARRRSIVRGDGPDGSGGATPSAAQYIVDKPPKSMRMAMGDHYYIPMRVTTLRIDVQHESPDFMNVMAPPMVEVIGVLTSGSSRRLGFISAASSRDKAILIEPMPASIGSKGESMYVNLSLVNPDAQFVMVVVAPCNGKNLRDVEKISFRVCDVSFFPGNPELCSYEYFTPGAKSTGAITLIFCRDRPNPPPAPAPPAKGGSKEAQAPPKEQPSPLWTIKALGQAMLQTKPTRHVHPGCEDLAKHLLQGWLPVPKGVHNSGGDPSRILSDRMTRKAQQRTIAKANNESYSATHSHAHTTSHAEEDSFFSSDAARQSDSDAGSLRDRRGSVDTATPVDQLEMEMENLYLMLYAPNQGRPRVVRRNRCAYSVGRATSAKQRSRHSSSSEEEEDSDDEELFRQVFTNFASRRVTRYENRCYNIGTEKDALLNLYLTNKEQFDTAMNMNAQPRAPLIVDRVFSDKDPEDYPNIYAGPPLLRCGGSPLHTDHEVAAFLRLPSASEDRLLSPSVEGSTPSQDRSPYQDSIFGALKPNPPMDMRSLRENQEKLRREQEAARIAAEEAAKAKQAAAAAAAAEGETAEGQAKMTTTTFKAFRNVAALQRTPRRGSPKSKRSPKPKRKNVQTTGMFNGQLLQWIDAFVKQQKTATARSNSIVGEERRPSIPTLVSSNNVIPFPPRDPVLSSEGVPPTAPRRRTSNAVVFHEPPPSRPTSTPSFVVPSTPRSKSSNSPEQGSTGTPLNR